MKSRYPIIVVNLLALTRIVGSAPTFPEKREDLWPNEEANELMKRLLGADEKLPEAIDWRDYGRVSSVKNQGECHSCWGFALAGLLEGQQRQVGVISGNQSIIDLSVQNLIDCTFPDENNRRWYNSCNTGGKISQAIAVIKRLGGIVAEKDYPYTSVNGEVCRFNESRVVMSVKSFAFIENGSESDVQKLVARFGPIIARIDAGGWMFRSYTGGVHFDPKCDPSSFILSHFALAVGYGTDKEEGDYWLVKNSWSEEWGEKGYVRMARNRDKNCGIASEFHIVLL